MFVKRAYLVAVLAVLSAGAAANAAAILVDATFDSLANQVYGSPVNVTVNYNTGTATGSDSSSAGIWSFTVNSITGGPDIINGKTVTVADVNSMVQTGNPSHTSPYFTAVCIDLVHPINWAQPNTVWQVESLAGLPTSVNGVGVSPQQASALAYLWDVYGVTAFTSNSRAAFQMAVWDILYDPTILGPSGASVSYAGISSSIVTTAYAEAQEAKTLGAGYSYANAYALVDTSNVQNFQIAFSSGTPVVPLPSSVGMGLSMLAGLGCVFGVRKRLHRSV